LRSIPLSQYRRGSPGARYQKLRSWWLRVFRKRDWPN